jgi:hypothetical protein
MMMEATTTTPTPGGGRGGRSGNAETEGGGGGGGGNGFLEAGHVSLLEVWRPGRWRFRSGIER